MTDLGLPARGFPGPIPSEVSKTMKERCAARTLLLAALAWVAVPGLRAELPAVDFDQGVDAEAFLAEAKASAAKEKTLVKPASQASFRRFDRDCVHFSFRPEDPARSESVWLRSQEWVEECRYDPPHGGRNCWERPGFSYSERVQVTLRERWQMYPWESDNFEVCLEGPWLDVYRMESAYEYKMVSGGNRDGNILMAPVQKTAMRPDPAGVTPQGLSSQLRLELSDRWAAQYAGETTVVSATLVKHVKFWPDATIVSKELSFPAAASYAVDFLSFAGEFSQRLEAGKEYYVKYKFRRLGRISKDKWTDATETGKAKYQPAAALAAR